MKTSRILFAVLATALIGCSSWGENLVDGFRTPPPGYGEVPFWWWNGARLDKARLLWQLDELHRAGISGVQINYCHLITGPWDEVPGDPDIFTDAWWDAFSFVAVECAKRNMGVGVSDYALAFPGRENLYKRLKICTPETYSQHLVFQKDGKVVPVVRPGTLDPMNAETARRLIERFFDPFLAHTPPEAHKALNYFFQDELILTDHQRIWTADFADEFKKRKGYDIVPKLRGLFTDIGPDTYKVRLDFNDVQVALTEERYFKPLYEWHAKRGLIYGCDHASRGKNPMQFGDYMRTTRWYTAPGFDTPGSGPDPVKCKVGSSISHLYHRPRVWLEGYHSQGWQASTETIFAATVRNYVYGANLFNLHGLYYTTEGGWWEWAPPCYHFRQPYWKLMPHTFKYFERLSWMLTRGVHVCDVAIVMPQEMMVVNSFVGTKSTALSHAFIRKLAVEGSCDCDVIDSDSLAAATIGRTEGAVTLDVAGEHYQAIVIPLMDTLRPTSRAKLDAFRAAGGTVVDAKKVDDVKLPLVATPDVAGNPGLKINHRRTAESDIYYVVDWDGKSTLTFRTTGVPSLYDPWTGAIHSAGERFQASTRNGLTTIQLPFDPGEENSCRALLFVFDRTRKGVAAPLVPKTLVRETLVTLPDVWEFELKPVLDNRWGDFHLPATPEFIGPEVREMTWVERGEKTRLEFGPQFWQDGTNVFSFGWRWNVADKPQQQNRHHGLNARVGDEFFILGPYSNGWDAFYDVNPRRVHGKSSPTTFTSFVYAPCDLEAEIVCTAEAAREKIDRPAKPAKPWPTAITVAGRRVARGEKVRLAKGYTPVEVSYNGFGRAALVFRRTDVAAQASTLPLSMCWYRDPSVLRYDPFGGKVTRGTFTATVPPGAYAAEIDTNGTVLRNEIKDGLLTVEVAFAPGLVGGAAFNGPIKLKMRAAPMKLGDWATTEGLRCYSGGAVYRTNVLRPDVLRPEGPRTKTAEGMNGGENSGMARGERLILNLGRVGCAAEVRVNGGPAHAVMCPPWEVDVTDDVKAGENAVEVTVYNTLNNHYQTIPTRYKVTTQKCPSGLLGPVKLESLRTR